MHTPPSYATPPSERDVTLLSVGQQCAHPSCLLVDFLPLKCIHCKLAFCQDHFRAQAHSCTEYDESAHNRVAPDCPLCNTPVAVRPGQDPNARMEQHFASECSVTTGRTKPANSFPHCAKPSCNKVLFSPIRCDKCKAQFCPAHRFPSDHKCVTSHSAVSSSASQASNTLAAMVANAKNVNSKAVAASTAIKRSVAATSASVGKPAIAASPVKSVPPAKSTPQSKPAPSTKQAHNNPFSKVDRRVKAERESRLQAMRVRAQKGLLSEEERLALEAEESQTKEKDKNCVIM